MEIIEQIYANKCISGENLEKLATNFGERLWKALRIITEKRVTKHIFKPSNKQIWIVSGKNRDYLIISDFYCTCDDFYLNVVIRKKIKVCYHILAKRLAEALNLYTSYTQTDDNYEKLMLKLKTLEIRSSKENRKEKEKK
jgi:predicted nucleic acid-binding Zn finger protein